MSLPYFIYRAESAKNTFLLCDSLSQANLDLIDLGTLHALLLEEGKDDLLLLLDGKEENGHLSAKFLVLGCDGEFGEFCGNGAKTLAAYLYNNYPSYSSFKLTTSKGAYPLKKLDADCYAAILPLPLTAWNPKFISDWGLFQKKYPHLRYLEAIEPHLTIEKAMEDDELLALGKELNEQKELFPLGINVNAWRKIDEKALFVKTYERGVQRLTLSCGTGSISSAAHAGLEGDIFVQTPGGCLQLTLTKETVQLSGSSWIEKTPFQTFTPKIS